MFDLSDRHVVVLPDVYVDALAASGPWPALRDAMDRVARQGGGNVPLGPVHLKVGGNAANLALAMAALGARTHLVAQTDRLGMALLEAAADGLPLDLSRVRVAEEVGATTLGLECDGANIMLSHPGPLAAFGPDRLEDEDWALIDKADAVAVVNWAQNKQGTPLLQRVAARAGAAGAFVYVDTADPRHRGEAMQELQDPAVWQHVSAWGMNENEVRAFGGTDGSLLDAAATLSSRLGVHIDLHTRELAASVDGTGIVAVDADPTPGRRLTGAGDAWNAGNLAGHLLGWEARRRLRLAHEVATRYVCSDDGSHPRPQELVVPA